MKTYLCRFVATGALGLGAIALSLAQGSDELKPSSSTKLVNLDTPLVLAPGQLEYRADFRGFGGDEKQPYGTIDVNAGLSPGFGLLVRSTFSKFSSFDGSGFTIRHGGSDLEAMIKYSPPSLPGLAVLGGFAMPNTPAHKTGFGSAEAVYQFPLKGASLFLGAKGVFGTHTNLIGITGGFEANLGPGYSLVGDADAILTGRNTYSTSTGNVQRNAVYGFAFRYSPLNQAHGMWSVDLGATNGLGGSTGFSMTPSLNSTIGVFVAATYRY